MTVERLENEMSGDELDEWMEFYSLEPFGDEEKMADLRHSVLCSLVKNAMGGEVPPSDFMMYKQKEITEENELEDWEAKLLRAMTTI